MYCVGLTGTIASGKSTIANLFENLGIHLISADAIAKQLTAPNQPALEAIKQHFGTCVVTPAGLLDRKALRNIVFIDPQKRLWLEQLLHPLIRQGILQAIQTIHTPYCVIEIPLLYDRKTYPYLNQVILVLADPKQQMHRLMQRDKLSQEQAARMLATQADNAPNQEIADTVIINNGSLLELTKKIEKLHHLYLQSAKIC